MSAAVALVAVPFTALLLSVIGKGGLTRWDQGVARDLNSFVWTKGWLVDGLQVVSWVGRPPTLYCVIAVSVVVLWRKGQVRLIPFVVITPLFGSLVNSAVKLTVDRPRPVVDHPVAHAFGKSFPSGHSFSSLVTYGVVLIAFTPMVPARARRWVWAAGVVGVAVIGASRVLLAVHFLSDVLAGFVLGAAYLLAALATFRSWRRSEDPVSGGAAPTPPPF